MSSRPAVLSPKEIGQLNRAKVLRALADHGPMSRSDLARSAGVGRGTMSAIVQGLLDDGLLLEHEPVGSGQVGKPARPLWFAPGAGAVLSVEVTSEHARAAVVDARGHVGPSSTRSIPDPSSADAVMGAVHHVVDEVAAEAGRPIGVGVSVPGACEPDGVVIASTQVPGASGGRLVSELAERTGLPASVENDSTAEALAEHWFGDGRRLRSFVSVHVGEGLGAGLVLSGTVHRGALGYAGEVGHMPVVSDGDACRCGLRGCWETIASLRWLRTEAERRGLGARAAAPVALVALADGGDATAQELLDRYADNLAVGLAVLAQTLDPERVILHGDVLDAGDRFEADLRVAVARRTLRDVDITFSTLEEPALLGAAAHVLSEQLHRAEL